MSFFRFGRYVLAAGIAGLVAPDLAVAVESFPQVRPATRAQAVTSLTAGGRLPVPCLSPMVQFLLDTPTGGNVVASRGMLLLQMATHVPGERRVVEQDGTTVRYSLQRGSFDRLEGTDENGDGRPDLVEAVLEGFAQARGILAGQLGLSAAEPVEALLVKIGSNVDGYTIPSGGADGRPLLVLDVSAGGPAAARKIAAHQYAHAASALAGGGIGPDWAEALATWTVLRMGAEPDPETAELLSARVRRLSEGLLSDDLGLAAGNAAWLSFVEEAYGPTALRLTVEELSRGDSTAAALERALLRAVGQTFSAAFREFQLWCLLVGDRADAHHFSFAAALASPAPASTSEGLPLLSVHREPAVAPLGSSTILLRPGETGGGLSVRFEGERPGRWEVDLLLVSEAGVLHRVPMQVSSEGRGEVRVPLRGLAEAILLVRSPDAEPRAARRYSWSAYAVRGFPFELASFEAVARERAAEGVVVTWETRSERGVLGFNVLRREEGAAAASRINPVWVPALGEESTPGAYQFVDVTALPGVSYLYQIEAITEVGLASESEPVSLSRKPLASR